MLRALSCPVRIISQLKTKVIVVCVFIFTADSVFRRMIDILSNHWMCEYCRSEVGFSSMPVQVIIVLNVDADVIV